MVAVGTLGREFRNTLRRFEPHMVVSSKPDGSDPGGRLAWYRLSPDPGEPSEVCVGGRRETAVNPGLGELLAAVDEAEDLILTGSDLGDC